MPFSRAQLRSCFLDWNHCSSHFFGATMGATDAFAPRSCPNVPDRYAHQDCEACRESLQDIRCRRVVYRGSSFRHKRWRFKYRLDGKEKRSSLGTYPEIGLRAARDRRDMARRLVAEGKDPSVAFRSGFPAVPKDEQGEFHGEALQTVAEEWFAKFEHSWKPSHARTIRIRLDKYVYDVLGSMPFRTLRRRTS